MHDKPETPRVWPRIFCQHDIKLHMNSYRLILVVCCLAVWLAPHHTVAQQITISLDSAKQMALRNNREIQQAQQNVAAAEAAKSAANAADKPTVDGSVVGLYLGQPLNTLLPETSLNGSLMVSEVVYAGGKIRNGKKMAQSSLTMQTFQQKLTTSDILLQTETAYWQLISLHEQVQLAEKYLLLLDTLLHDLNNSYEVGMIYKNDVLRVEVQKNEAVITLQQAHDGLEIARRSFAQRIGATTLDFTLADEVPNVQAILSAPTDLQNAVNQRPEIAILQESVTLQETQADLLAGDRRPSLALTANGIYARGNQINFSDGTNDFTSVIGLVSINVPIMDWGSRKQKVKQQQAKAQAQQLELKNTEELLRIEIRNAYLELTRAYRTVSLSENSVAQAAENLRLLNDQFHAGTITGKDVLEGQVLWQEAYAKMIDAKASLKINEAKYKKAIAEY